VKKKYEQTKNRPKDIRSQSVVSLSRVGRLRRGEATVSRVYKQYGSIWVDIIEGDRSYNWDIIGLGQAKLRKEYKGQKAHPAPDIDTPWIEEGDTVNGEVHHGPSIW
jgi:hypothetical protein